MARFEKALERDIKEDNYSNSPGGQAATRLILENAADIIDALMTKTRHTPGKDHATVARNYRGLLDVPFLDLDTGQQPLRPAPPGTAEQLS